MSKPKYLPTTTSKSKPLSLVLLLLGLYFLDTPYFSSRLDGQLFKTIIQPLCWLGVALVVRLLPKVRPKGLLRLKGFLCWWSFNLAVLFIVVSIVAGLIDGLGKSPYSHTLTGILLNIVAIGSALVGRELVRSYLVGSLARYENYYIFAAVAAFMTLTDFPLLRFSGLHGYQDIVKFIAQYLAPEYCQNLLATYLAYLGGPLPAITYVGIIEAFHWLSPILPDLKWITAALVGVLAPVFSLMFIQNLYLNEAKIKDKEQEKESTLGWMATSLVAIAIIWFAVGVFPIYPSVIATGSMEPMVKPGDVVLVKKVARIEEISKGEVIQFERDGILISHRIIEIVQDEKEGTSFRTKGDNNSGPDKELVQPKQIKGEIVKVVPKVGWPTLMLKSEREIPLDEIVF